jgi:hypothetical protein
MAIPNRVDVLQGSVIERFEIVFLPTGRDGVYNLIKVQVNKKARRFKCFFCYAVFSSFKQYAVENHGANSFCAMTRTHTINSTAPNGRVFGVISPARAFVRGTPSPRRASWPRPMFLGTRPFAGYFIAVTHRDSQGDRKSRLIA